MLKRKSIKRLFSDNDLNIPVTIFSLRARNNDTVFHKQAWLQTIKDTLYEYQKIIYLDQTYHFIITSSTGKIYEISSTFKNFVDEFKATVLYEEPMSIRIDISEDSDCSWIILLKSDIL